MPNPDTGSSDGLELRAGCQPDPVSASSHHRIDLRNVGTDRYDIRVDAWILGPSIEGGASIAFSDNGKLLRVVSWTAGTFGPKTAGTWSKQVARFKSGTALSHSIRTVANFNSDAENDPLDPDPHPYKYKCYCTIDVAVQ